MSERPIEGTDADGESQKLYPTDFVKGKKRVNSVLKNLVFLIWS